jgi:probable F420-dependent oxidoreductase
MRIGALVQNFGGFPETGRSTRACVELAQHAELVGLDSVWVTDHIVLPGQRRARYPHNDTGTFPYGPSQDIHEPLVLMGALAWATSRVEIGVAVLVIPYRHPLTTAKMLATIDQLSGGRVILGAGVGWLRDEFDALGLAPEIYEHRGSVTVDYLLAMQAAWAAEGTASYRGRYVAFDDVGARPRPARQPHLPIWVGGKGDRALRRAAAFGNGYLAISSTPELLTDEVRQLHRFARQYDRDPAELTVSLIDGIAVTDKPLGTDRNPLHGTPEQIVEGLAAFAAAGLVHLVAGIRLADDVTFAGAQRALDLVGRDVLPALRQSSP